MIRVGWHSAVLLLGATQGLVVAALLVATRTNRTANRLLAAFLLCFALRLTPYVLGYAGAYDAWPWLTFAPFDARLAFGPLLWLYVRTLTRGASPRRWALHLAPAAAVLLFDAWACLALSVPEKRRFTALAVDPWLDPAVNALTVLSLAGYGRRVAREVRAYRRWLHEEVSDAEPYALRWLRPVLAALALTLVVWVGFTAVDAFVRPLGYLAEFPEYVWLSVVVFGLGLAGWRHAGVRYPVPADEGALAPAVPAGAAGVGGPAASPAVVLAVAPDAGADGVVEDAGADPDEDAAHHALGARWAAKLAAAGWWRDPALTRAALAERLGTSPRTLSRVLNAGLGVSFHTLVNRIRVEAVAAELRDPARARDLLHVAFDAGFRAHRRAPRRRRPPRTGAATGEHAPRRPRTWRT